QKKVLESMTDQSARHKASRLITKARNDRLLEVVPGDRRTLIEIASQALDINPDLTVILANQAGDVVCMSRTKDSSRELKNILEKAGGSGGGSKELAQGRLELSKLMRLIEKG
ncbi:MAG: hypothetical protein KAT35_00820, partial [Candidatus Aenigmarchaeota archaeon]|nr:hypothetical protein [Candidatus Aenigmarchaeota archaeon]